MLKVFRKPILFMLIFGISANFCNFSYCDGVSTSIPSVWSKITDAPTWKKVAFAISWKNIIATKDKFCKFAKIEPAKTILTSAAIFTSTFIVITLISKMFYKLIGNILEDASPKTKKCIVGLAKKLGMKNPESINVKILPEFLFGTYEPLGPNAFATTTGDMLISKNFDNNPESNESKYVFGHELTHIKDKYVLKLIAINSVKLSSLILFVLYGKIANNKKTNFIGKVILLGAADKFFNYLNNYFFGRYFEKQADLGAASLGKDVTEGGIQFFKKMKTMEIPTIFGKKVSAIYSAINDPHPPLETRIKYLRKYIEQHYPNNKPDKRTR